MCNLYSITTNQAAIAALFRVVNRYVGNLAPMTGVFPDYPAPVIRNTGTGTELTLMRWGMPPPPKMGGPPVTNIPQHVIATLARRAEAGEPVLGPGQQLRRIRARAQPRDQENGRGLVRTERGPPTVRLRWHLDDVQRASRHEVEAGARAASGLWFSHDIAERGGRADPSQDDAGDPDDRRRAGRVDARTAG
jgi:hypothetical protein